MSYDAKNEEPILQFFNSDHLPEPLRAIAKLFHSVAVNMTMTLPRNPERSAGLRKLLEAKDCMVRAQLYKNPTPYKPLDNDPVENLRKQGQL